MFEFQVQLSDLLQYTLLTLDIEMQYNMLKNFHRRLNHR